MPKSKCLKISKKQGETVLALAKELGLVNKSQKIQRDNNNLYIPLVNTPSTKEMKSLREQIRRFELVTHHFPRRTQPQPSLAELLRHKLPKNLLSKLPHTADFVGTIGIVEIPSELQLYRAIIGNAILEANRNLQTVLAKAGPVSGSYRLREFTTIAGVQNTETIHAEYGCQFYVDVAKAYFSPRLSYEHNRIASLVQEGETIVDLFSGIGPFAIMIAKKHENVRVYAVDINPDAFALLEKNIRLNRVDGKVHPILGDARQVSRKKLTGKADQVIMNLPESAITFVDAACHVLKPEGGVIHFYSFTKASISSEEMKKMFSEAVKRCGRNVDAFLLCRSVRETAPYENQVVFDVRVR